MWQKRKCYDGGLNVFFRISLDNENLYSMYKMNSDLMYYHKYSLTELENMIPFERKLYIDLLVQTLEKEKEEAEKQKNGNNRI